MGRNNLEDSSSPHKISALNTLKHKILTGEAEYSSFADAVDSQNSKKFSKIQSSKNLRGKGVKKISNGKLEEYRKYYYTGEGNLAKRNDSPQSVPYKVKFGQPKEDFQEGPLEDYLFTGINKFENFIQNIKIKPKIDHEVEPPSVEEEGFLDSLQKLEHSATIKSLNRSCKKLDPISEGNTVNVVLLTRHNIERITKRLNIFRSHQGSFKYESSVTVKLPKRIETTDRAKMDEQFASFLMDVSERLKQNKTLKHLYFLNGTPIFSLNEILPDSRLFVSHSPFFQNIIRESSKYLKKSPRSGSEEKLTILSENEKSTLNILDLKDRYTKSYNEDLLKIKEDVRQRFVKPVPEEVIQKINDLLKKRRKNPKINPTNPGTFNKKKLHKTFVHRNSVQVSQNLQKPKRIRRVKVNHNISMGPIFQNESIISHSEYTPSNPTGDVFLKKFRNFKNFKAKIPRLSNTVIKDKETNFYPKSRRRRVHISLHDLSQRSTITKPDNGKQAERVLNKFLPVNLKISQPSMISPKQKTQISKLQNGLF